MIVVLLGVVGGGLYANVESVPGYAPWQDRTSTVLRQLGFGAALDTYENWLYSRHAPSNTQPDVRGLMATTTAAAAPYRYLPHLAGTADHLGWHPIPRLPAERPMIYTALLQPDQGHRSVIVGVALLRTPTLTAHLMAGTAEPPGAHSPGHIPSAQLPDVVAAFNSGFKSSAHPGGFFLDGTAIRPLEDGKASAVIDDRGRLTVGQWGREVSMTPHVVAVRQNLALVVDGGAPVPGLDRNTDRRWGSARNQLQYTWRSGLGVTSHGDLIYAAGDKLTLTTLGAAMVQAGVVTGMELDIHSGLQFFSSWRGDGTAAPQPHRLLPSMVGPSERYVHPDIRDFFYFTTNGDISAATR
ncbi:hypothetical protein H7J06_02715 [Mycobacterium hodleri]|uniref:hypothetical protein n=1 Tax=Mycolicibacterium hodleri TaxID=49897 RepID=UPI0021F2F563|nr:hypothetical protein [Mycolicibacterium hodleri]MCV7131886.1 hypothetical protein [Mycolicibacterium hodleri]